MYIAIALLDVRRLGRGVEGVRRVRAVLGEASRSVAKRALFEEWRGRKVFVGVKCVVVGISAEWGCGARLAAR